MKYLPVYYKWSESETKDTYMYLCNRFGHKDKYLDLVRPTDSDLDDLWTEGHATFAWGEGDHGLNHPDATDAFPPLRRNLLLFMAAMNNEL